MFSFHNLHFFVMEIIAIYTDKNSASFIRENKDK